MKISNRQMKEFTDQLYLLFDELNLKYFDSTLPSIALRFTGRLKTSGGQYIFKPYRLIQISIRYFEHSDPWNEIRDTLGHEMIHYWLDHHGLPCGHTPLFRKKLLETGFSRYSRLAPTNRPWIYQCPGCQALFHRKKPSRVPMSCASCSKRKFNPAFALKLIERPNKN